MEGAAEMTRDEFETTLKQARQFGGYGLEPFFESLLSHDNEQRQEIARLRKTLDTLLSEPLVVPIKRTHDNPFDILIILCQIEQN